MGSDFGTCPDDQAFPPAIMIVERSYSVALLSSLLSLSIHLAQATHLANYQTPLSQDDSVTNAGPISRVISTSPLLSFHRSLCQIESITNNEHSVGSYLFSYLRRHNLNVLRREVPQPGDSKNKKKRFNVFAWPKDTASSSDSDIENEDEDDILGDLAPKVILTSHIDTVPPFIPYSVSSPSSSPPDLQGETFNRSAILISGRGTVDAKACVAAQIHAVLSLLSPPPPNHQLQHSNDDNDKPPPKPSTLPIALLFVVGEEHSGDGMKTFSRSPLHRHLSHPRHDKNPYGTLIFGEPTESLLASGHKGLLLFTLHAQGHAAHSGYPWLGRSANSMLIPVLAAVDQLGDLPESEGGLPRSEKYGRSTVNIGVVRGGVAANVIPERARAEIAVRLAGGTPELAQQTIEKAVTSVNEDVEVVFSGQGYPPVDLDADVDGFANTTVNYGTDVPNLVVGRRGVRRYLFGPGSILVAHGEREGLTVGDLEAAVGGYRRLILEALRR